MTTDEARNRIFSRLCREYKENGVDSWIDWEPLEQELEIPHKQFVEAITGITNSVDAELSHDLLGHLYRDQPKKPWPLVLF